MLDCMLFYDVCCCVMFVIKDMFDLCVSILLLFFSVFFVDFCVGRGRCSLLF